MLSKDALSLLGLASRARKISTGDILLKDIRSQRVYLVIIADDASDNTKKKYTDKCSYYNVNYCIDGCVNDLSRAIGKTNRVAIGITDKGFSDKIKSKLGG